MRDPARLLLRCLRRSRRLAGDVGANVLEYALLLTFVLLACLSAMTFFGRGQTGRMSCVSSAVVNQVGADC